ncbi:exonuclease SbcCD subunit D [Candidatus Bathyarchaeota archaeon]|nr:exonuclease SbcCD subunit D [Candidatus Bathyarchaeota archaeon]
MIAKRHDGVVRIAHLADTHLGYKQYNLEEREKDIYNSLEEITDKILEEHVDIVVHSGDLFDSSRPTPEAYRALKVFLKKLDGKIRIFAVLGDHDRPKSRGIAPHLLFEDQMQVLGSGGNAQHQELNIDGKKVVVAGLPNLSRTYRPILLEEMKKLSALKFNGIVSILLLHEGIDRFLPFEGAYELTMSEIPSNFNYVAMGHIHARIQASLENGELSYPGSSEVMSKNEISGWEKLGKGFNIVDIDSSGIKISRINLEHVRPQIETKLSYLRLDEELETLIKKLDSMEKLPIVHIRVSGKNIDRQRVHQTLALALTNKTLTFRQEIDDTTEPHLPELRQGAVQVNQVIQDYFKDETTAGLAMELWNQLRYGETEEAKKIAEAYFRRAKT